MPLIGEVRLRRTSLTPIPCGLGAGHTPPSAVVRVPVQVGGQVEGVLVLGGGGGVREGGRRREAGYSRGPGSPVWRRQVLPYRSGEDAPPREKETGSRKHRRSAD